MFKKIALISMLIIAIFLTGCSGSKDESTKKANDGKKTVTTKFPTTLSKGDEEKLKTDVIKLLPDPSEIPDTTKFLAASAKITVPSKEDNSEVCPGVKITTTKINSVVTASVSYNRKYPVSKFSQTKRINFSVLQYKNKEESRKKFDDNNSVYEKCGTVTYPNAPDDSKTVYTFVPSAKITNSDASYEIKIDYTFHMNDQNDAAGGTLPETTTETSYSVTAVKGKYQITAEGFTTESAEEMAKIALAKLP